MSAEQYEVDTFYSRSLIHLVVPVTEANNHFPKLTELPVPLLARLVEPPLSIDVNLVVVSDLELGLSPEVARVAHRPKVR